MRVRPTYVLGTTAAGRCMHFFLSVMLCVPLVECPNRLNCCWRFHQYFQDHAVAITVKI